MPGKKMLFTLGITAALCIGVIVDLAPYQAAIDIFPTARLEASSNKQSSDIGRFGLCSQIKGAIAETRSEESSEKLRKCLVNALNETQTSFGAVFGAAMASTWLSEHQEDEEVKDAALRAIEKGRANLIQEKWYYDGLQRMAQAHNESVILLVKSGPQSEDNMFVKIAERLDKAEFSVRDPEVTSKQIDWLRETLIEDANARADSDKKD